MKLWRLLACPLLVCPGLVSLALATVSHAETLTHGRFKDLEIYKPQEGAQRVVLLLSGEEGWSPRLTEVAQALARDGALVAGIDTRALFTDFEKDAADCVTPTGDLENLSRFLQAYYRLPSYRPPLLVGYTSGATFVYAMLAQAPAGTFAGGVSVAFHSRLNLRKPLCPTANLSFMTRDAGDGDGVRLRPASGLDSPWLVLQARGDGAAAAREFVEHIHGADLVALSSTGSQDAARSPSLSALRAAVRTLAKPSEPVVLPRELHDLPIVEVAAKSVAQSGAESGHGDVLAVLLSGDGGWAGIDKQIAAHLAQQGIAVVGLDSLRYFWSKRTPQSTAADVERILRHYLARWHKQRVLLIGYSQGADVLPFVVNRLPAQTLANVQLVALLGMGRDAEFEFRLATWITNTRAGLPIRPEIDRSRGVRMLCVYGAGDSDVLCPQLSHPDVRAIELPGGHHFDGNYARVATLLIEHLTDP